MEQGKLEERDGLRRVLFLDIDGVLVNSRTLMRSEADPKCVEILNGLLEKTGAEIVVSSSWRHMGVEKLSEVFRAWGVSGRIAGITPPARQADSGIWEGMTRGHQIRLWLEENGPAEFAIVDDEEDCDPYSSRLVKTSFATGLTEAEAERIAILLLR